MVPVTDLDLVMSPIRTFSGGTGGNLFDVFVAPAVLRDSGLRKQLSKMSSKSFTCRPLKDAIWYGRIGHAMNVCQHRRTTGLANRV